MRIERLMQRVGFIKKHQKLIAKTIKPIMNAYPSVRMAYSRRGSKDVYKLILLYRKELDYSATTNDIDILWGMANLYTLMRSNKLL